MGSKMKQHKFDDLEDYRDTQIRLTRTKYRKNDGHPKCYTTETVVQSIFNALIGSHFDDMGTFTFDDSDAGLCHGVRTGDEIDMFTATFGGTWIGTEITPECCDGVKIIEHDFHEIRSDWIDKFKIVYTNALDHAHDPIHALRVWIDQLKPDGRLIIEWSKWSATFRSRNRADCFAASENEYRDMLEQVATIEEMVKVIDDETFNRTLFIVDPTPF